MMISWWGAETSASEPGLVSRFTGFGENLNSCYTRQHEEGEEQQPWVGREWGQGGEQNPEQLLVSHVGPSFPWDLVKVLERCLVLEQWASGNKWWKRRLFGGENLKHWGNASPCDFFDVWGQLCEEWAVDSCPSKANVCCVLFFILKSKQQWFFLHSLCQHMGKAYVSGCSIRCVSGSRASLLYMTLSIVVHGQEGREKCEVLEQLTVFNILICSEI